MENSQPRVMHANSSRFIRAIDPYEAQQNAKERPLTLTAWTQTEGDDFALLQNIDYGLPEPAMHGANINKVIFDKIRFLQESLRQHTELLTEIHATNGATRYSPEPPLQQQQPQQYTARTPSPANTSLTRSTTTPPQQLQILTPPNSVINQTLPHAATYNATSTKYKIVADNSAGGANCYNDIPIEIKLNNDDINTSVDSDRLEICLNDEQLTQEETIHTTETYAADNDDTPMMLIKRAKIDTTRLNTDEVEIKFVNEEQQQTAADVKPTLQYKLPSRPVSTSPPSSVTVIALEEPKKRKICALRRPILKTANHNNNNNMEACDNNSNYNANSTAPNEKNNNNVLQPQKPEQPHVYVSIGPNNTKILAKVYESINWNSSSIATRKLLMATFDRQTLATHSMTGKPSPAFKDTKRPLKEMLDPFKIQDIIFAVTNKCGASEKEVRNAITTKCADENKMMKLQIKRHSITNGATSGLFSDKENLSMSVAQ